MHFSRLYPILDASCFARADAMFAAAEELAASGVTLLQYRNKSGNARQMLEQARELKRLVGGRMKLIMNDRADLCLAADFDGLHVGQDDLSPEAARRIIGAERCAGWCPRIIPEQLVDGRRRTRRLLAIGPVFATSSKVNPDPVVGLEGVRRARELTRKPLVAIGGITRANARSVIEAGADARCGDIRLDTGAAQISRGIFADSAVKLDFVNRNRGRRAFYRA